MGVLRASWYEVLAVQFHCLTPVGARKNCMVTLVASTRSGRRPAVEALGFREAGKRVRITTLGGSSVFKDRAPRTGHHGRVERGGPDRFFSLRIPDGGGYSGVSGFGDGQGQSKAWRESTSTSNKWLFLVSASSHTIGDTITRLWLLTGPSFSLPPISAAGLHDGIH